MIKRIVIAGCRDYNNYAEAKTYIDFCLSDIRRENNIIIVSSCASGADAIGERYAEENGFKVEKYPADWKNTAEVQDQNEINRWQRSAIMLFVFGTKRARVQSQ